MLKFGQKEVTTKDFYGQRQITDILTIEVNKVVVCDNVPCNNRKDCCYIVGYQVDGTLLPLFIKTPKNIFSYGVSQYGKTLPIQCHLMFLRQGSGCPNIKRFGMRLSHSYLKTGGRTNKRRRQVRPR